MATVTGLTAARMLEIEAASVVDGDVVGDNLILTKHDGSQINAGSVRGPQGVQGPIGQDTRVIPATSVLEVGLANQIRAGRQLSPADFANLGLSAPAGLWNLSDLSDVSGNGRNLSNKGAVPFAVGINGNANTAALFAGATTQALYISDTGAADPFRIRTGSFGAWMRTAKRLTQQSILGKWNGSTNQRGYELQTDPTNNTAVVFISWDGTSYTQVNGVTNICDDAWHFVVITADGLQICIYVDGVLEGFQVTSGWPVFGSSAPINIGAVSADAATAAAQPHFGRVDEAFITSDVLSEEQVRNLYCAKFAHTLGAVPARISLSVHRKRKGPAFAAADFPTQPLRLHNFSAGSLGDEGSGNVALISNPGTGSITSVAGVDGAALNAFQFMGAHTGLSSTDAGLPSGTPSSSVGCWVKTGDVTTTTKGIVAWGAVSTKLLYTASGNILSVTGTTADFMTGSFIADGEWHFVVLTEENAPADGVKRKMYVDGKIVGETLVLNAYALAGANHFRVGADSGGANPFVGVIDGVFVCDYVLTSDQIRTLFAKGSQLLASSPKNSGDHVEAMDSANIYATFDILDSQHQVDLVVA